MLGTVSKSGSTTSRSLCGRRQHIRAAYSPAAAASSISYTSAGLTEAEGVAGVAGATSKASTDKANEAMIDTAKSAVVALAHRFGDPRTDTRGMIKRRQNPLNRLCLQCPTAASVYRARSTQVCVCQEYEHVSGPSPMRRTPSTIHLCVRIFRPENCCKADECVLG